VTWLPLCHRSPQIRPISKRSKSAYLQVGVETYGGGIWHSWLDRDLSIAGRVVIADKGGNFTSKLVKIDRPILRIPTLAIHCQPPFFNLLRLIDNNHFFFSVDRSVNDNLRFNQETEFIPILGLIASQLNSPPLESDDDKDDKPPSGGPKVASSIQENHHPALLSLLAGELSVASEEIHDFEL